MVEKIYVVAYGVQRPCINCVDNYTAIQKAFKNFDDAYKEAKERYLELEEQYLSNSNNYLSFENECNISSFDDGHFDRMFLDLENYQAICIWSNVNEVELK